MLRRLHSTDPIVWRLLDCMSCVLTYIGSRRLFLLFFLGISSFAMHNISQPLLLSLTFSTHWSWEQTVRTSCVNWKISLSTKKTRKPQQDSSVSDTIDCHRNTNYEYNPKLRIPRLVSATHGHAAGRIWLDLFESFKTRWPSICTISPAQIKIVNRGCACWRPLDRNHMSFCRHWTCVVLFFACFNIFSPDFSIIWQMLMHAELSHTSLQLKFSFASLISAALLICWSHSPWFQKSRVSEP